MRKTIRCKLVVSAEDRMALLETLSAFAAACNDLAAFSRAHNIKHRWALSAHQYRVLRDKYPQLQANYVVRVCERVAWAARRGHNEFRPTSVILDKNLCRYITPAESISVATVRGRKHIPLSIGAYQRDALVGVTAVIGTISVTHAGDFYVNIQILRSEPAVTGGVPLGLDLGIRRIVTTSDGQMFSGRKLNRKRERYARTRASLQAKGTKGSRRVLRRLSGKEARFQKDINHSISKQLVQHAKANDRILVLEELKGIRGRCNRKGNRHSRRSLNRWAFYQLRAFLAYKAQEAGVAVAFVNPAYTSRRCPYCGDLGHRVKLSFSCSCGFVGDADISLARSTLPHRGRPPLALKPPLSER